MPPAGGTLRAMHFQRRSLQGMRPLPEYDTHKPDTLLAAAHGFRLLYRFPNRLILRNLGGGRRGKLPSVILPDDRFYISPPGISWLAHSVTLPLPKPSASLLPIITTGPLTLSIPPTPLPLPLPQRADHFRDLTKMMFRAPSCTGWPAGYSSSAMPIRC